jgi:hypothetical protein
MLCWESFLIVQFTLIDTIWGYLLVRIFRYIINLSCTSNTFWNTLTWFKIHVQDEMKLVFLNQVYPSNYLWPVTRLNINRFQWPLLKVAILNNGCKWVHCYWSHCFWLAAYRLTCNRRKNRISLHNHHDQMHTSLQL